VRPAEFFKSKTGLVVVALLVLITAAATFLPGINYQGLIVKVGEGEYGKDRGSNIAVLETNRGTIKIELFLDRSPVTAGNFKKLVEQGFYDGTRFHRVIENFVIQGGDPNSRDVAKMDMWGTGNPGYVIKDEFIEGLSNVRGTVSMANSGPNSGGSQFFINVKDNTGLDWDKPPYSSKHPVFGRVVEGMDVVDSISRTETTGPPYDRPLRDVIISRAYME